MICADWSAETSNGSGRGGLTQEQFAEISGFSQQYISSLERGRRNPTVITLYELSVALGVNHVDLIRPRKGRHQGR
jgi:transcriptional regulator with XRE-family HTH domain